MNTRYNGLVNASSQALGRHRGLSLILGDVSDRRFINSFKKEGDRELCRPVWRLSVTYLLTYLLIYSMEQSP
jgi:hypothetical protein